MITHRNRLIFSTFQDLDHAVLLLVGTKFVLQGGLGGTVHDTLGTVTVKG